jgi:hypothetical protein
MLTRLPRHRLVLKGGEVSRQAAGADLQRLQQRGAAGHGVTTAPAQSLSAATTWP